MAFGSIPVEMRRTCPVCDGSRLTDLWMVYGYTLARCGDCSLVFVRNAVDSAYLDAYYASTSAEGSDQKVYNDPKNSAALRHAYGDMARRIKKRVPEVEGRKLRLLDVGCSTGLFFEEFPEWETHGVEITKDHGAMARERYGNVFIGNMSDAHYPADFFDCITLQDSLDHSHDPVGVVAGCRESLRPGGLIAIKVHNISCLWARMCGKRFYAVNPPGHMMYFNLASLKRLLERAGFAFGGHFYNTHRLKVSTALLRLARGDSSSWFTKAHSRISGTWPGNLMISKNLHDIITVFGIKR